jgi:hypothetical protein
MDELPEVAELAGDLGLDGALAWLLRLLGLLSALAGLALWLGLGWDLLVLPAALLALGFVLLILPSVALVALELVA